jgi:hypothetical protein
VKSTLELEKSVGGTWRPAFKKHPSDRITVKSPTIVRYVTPPHHDGLGTRSRLAPDALPIQGEVILIKDEGDFDMIQLDVRLLGVRTALASTIRSGAEANHGAALSDTPLQMPADN